MQEILVSETNGHSKRKYTSHNGKLTVSNNSSESRNLPWLLSIKHFLITLLLPQGYPNSVSDDYIDYQMWEAVQNLASSVNRTLATYATLKGLGVGDENASAISATFTWLLKSGSGMTANIVFAYVQGSKLDADCKRWRLFADIICDCVFILEILSPHLTSAFLLCQCLASVLSSLVSVAANGSKSALKQHQARQNNFADISAKAGSQGTIVSFVGLMVSASITPIIGHRQDVIFVLCFTLVAIHLYANYKVVRASRLDSLNLNRFGILYEHYSKCEEILSVRETNDKENVWFFVPSKFDSLIVAGVPIQATANGVPELKVLKDIFKYSDYILNYVNGQIKISFRSNDSEAVFKAVFHAFYVLQNLNSSKRSKKLLSSEILMIIRESLPASEKEQSKFNVLCARKGWDTSRFTLVMSDWTYSFDD
ncbi:Protein root UVB sensitive 3 [Halotydeus destructor]|nr:Protein root UVB sensitive 3 [Halotydeus destructor]